MIRLMNRGEAGYANWIIDVLKAQDDGSLFRKSRTPLRDICAMTPLKMIRTFDLKFREVIIANDFIDWDAIPDTLLNTVPSIVAHPILIPIDEDELGAQWYSIGGYYSHSMANPPPPKISSTTSERTAEFIRGIQEKSGLRNERFFFIRSLRDWVIASSSDCTIMASHDGCLCKIPVEDPIIALEYGV